MTAFTYGKLAPHPEDSHPRVRLSDHLESTPAVPAVVDWASEVVSWPDYGNFKIGDCTCAALGHAVQAWTTYGEGETVTLPYDVILHLYEAVSGYDPQTGANDHGAVEQNVLTYVQQHGIGDHKIRAFAQVNHKDLIEMKHALDIFGTVYVGFQVPQSAEGQFFASQVWTPAPQSPIVGGHAVDIQKWDADYIYCVTWGKLQPMTPEFWLSYGDEAWVILTEDWVNNNTGLTPTGLNLDSLLAEFDALNGTPDRPYVSSPGKGCAVINWIKGLFT